MAQSEHLPIYKRGYELCLYLEQVVRATQDWSLVPSSDHSVRLESV